MASLCASTVKSLVLRRATSPRASTFTPTIWYAVIMSGNIGFVRITGRLSFTRNQCAALFKAIRVQEDEQTRNYVAVISQCELLEFRVALCGRTVFRRGIPAAISGVDGVIAAEDSGRLRGGAGRSDANYSTHAGEYGASSEHCRLRDDWAWVRGQPDCRGSARITNWITCRKAR